MLFHEKANGQFIRKSGDLIGSRLIGQPFVSDKYFHSRASAPGNGYDAANSSGSFIVRFCERLGVRLPGPTLPHICGKNGLGRLMVRRATIRKRMRAKLREVKQQLRKRMHDPVPQTGGWLKSVVQGYFNYYAVPGNLKSLGVFRDRVIALWWRTIRRRSQKRRISWTRTLALAQRWLPQPRALHPFPDARFAATHPR